MKKRFSDQQIISLLSEAEAGLSARELCLSTPFSTPPLTPGVISTDDFTKEYLKIIAAFGVSVVQVTHIPDSIPLL